jgi:hypothetical protein
MKTLVLSNSTGIHVELLTDLIGNNKEFTIYQVQERVNGRMRVGLTDETIASGVNFGIESKHVGEIIDFCEAHDFTLVSRETGAEDEVLYQGSYYGDVIGDELV